MCNPLLALFRECIFFVLIRLLFNQYSLVAVTLWIQHGCIPVQSIINHNEGTISLLIHDTFAAVRIFCEVRLSLQSRSLLSMVWPFNSSEIVMSESPSCTSTIKKLYAHTCHFIFSKAKCVAMLSWRGLNVCRRFYSFPLPGKAFFNVHWSFGYIS